MLKVGDRVPELLLIGSDGEAVRLSEVLAGRIGVIYFYPKDDTMVCTLQARGFRDHYEDFVAAGAEVIGISADPPASHRSFCQKHALPFTLLSDESNAARAAFGVKSLLGHPGRSTFVVDRGGTIRLEFTSALRAGAHVQQALELVRQLARENA